MEILLQLMANEGFFEGSTSWNPSCRPLKAVFFFFFNYFIILLFFNLELIKKIKNKRTKKLKKK